jgi:hypothetical protein
MIERGGTESGTVQKIGHLPMHSRLQPGSCMFRMTGRRRCRDTNCVKPQFFGSGFKPLDGVSPCFHFHILLQITGREKKTQ